MATRASTSSSRRRKPRQQGKSASAKMRAYRERMRAAGMRQVSVRRDKLGPRIGALDDETMLGLSRALAVVMGMG